MNMIPRHYCAGCGKEIGFMPHSYVCQRNGAACPPHTPTPRKTKRRPAPVIFADCPDIRVVLGLDQHRPTRNRPSTAGEFPTPFGRR